MIGLRLTSFYLYIYSDKWGTSLSLKTVVLKLLAPGRSRIATVGLITKHISRDIQKINLFLEYQSKFDSSSLGVPLLCRCRKLQEFFNSVTAHAFIGISKVCDSHQLTPNLDSAQLFTKLSIARTFPRHPLCTIIEAHTLYFLPTGILCLNRFKQSGRVSSSILDSCTPEPYPSILSLNIAFNLH